MKKYIQYTIGVENSLDLEFLLKFINSFFTYVMSPLREDQVVLVIVRVEYYNGMIRSFSL
jgi:hypothetical protein